MASHLPGPPLQPPARALKFLPASYAFALSPNLLQRKILGALKDKSEPVDLPVYPVQVKDGKIYVKFAK